MSKQELVRGVYIGAHNIAARHRGVAPEIEGFELVGYASLDGTHDEALGPDNRPLPWGEGIAGKDGWQGLLDKTKPDVVFLFVPPGAHGPIEERLLADGIAFFTEKPLANSLEVSGDIADEVTRTGLLTAVGLQWRAGSHIPAARDRLHEIGPDRITSVRSVYYDAPIKYSPPWWPSVGQVREQVPHVADMTRYLLEDMMGDITVTDASIYPVRVADWRKDFNRKGLQDMKTEGHTVATFGFADAQHVQGVFEASSIHKGDRVVQVVVAYDDGNSSLFVTREGFKDFPYGEDPVHVPQEGHFVTAQTLQQDRSFVAAYRNGDPNLVYSHYPDAYKTDVLCDDIITLAQANIVNQPIFQSAA